MRRPFPTTFVLVAALSVLGCETGSDPKTPPPPPPAEVARKGDEQQLATIVLTPKAEQRLGIRTVALKWAEVRRKRTLGGEVVVPPGQTVTISAPVMGTLTAPHGGTVPRPGSQVGPGQPVFGFLPLLSPERDVLTPAERVRVAETRVALATAQLEAEREVKSAKVRVEAAQIAYDRALQLFRDQAGSQRTVDETQAQCRLAREALATAEARFEFLAGMDLDADAGESQARTIAAPAGGILQSVDVAPGETVAAGAALFRVVSVDPVWLRVPVYVGHWRDVDAEKDALFGEYGQRPDTPLRSAKPVAAPPAADPAASTVDLFYEVPNGDRCLYPGQRLAVTLTLRSEQKSLVAPWSTVLYDSHGGAWVYEQIAAQTYVRRRVEVKYVDKPNAIFAAGPQPGAKLVTDGAVELYGTEFGFGK